MLFYIQAVANGIDSVLKIIAEKNINGVYGPLIDNFTCEDKYFTAVEVTAGNKYVITTSFGSTMLDLSCFEKGVCCKKILVLIYDFSHSRLFNVIVDNDKIGSQILSIMNKQKMPGEVTFMPLNRLNFRDIDYPKSPVSNECSEIQTIIRNLKQKLDLSDIHLDIS